MTEGGFAFGGAEFTARRPIADASSASLRTCLARFATGVTVVTFATREGPRGLTVNAFTSVSLRPPLVLVSVARSAHAHALLRDTPFCVNVLSAEQEEHAARFAGTPAASAPHWAAPCEHGVPRLEGTIAFLECSPWRTYEAGDHSLFLGEVRHFGHRKGAALVYFSHRFTSVVENELGVEYLI